MSKPRRRTPDAERHSVAIEALEISDSQELGGFKFSATNGQTYGIVNDALMIFANGSGFKTIAERVAAGKVALHDGHPYERTSKNVVGRVLSASEAGGTLPYTGLISSVEGDLVTKMRERIINENSLELIIMKERPIEVDLEMVPVLAQRWVERTTAGKAIVREVLEWSWRAMGLVVASSQDMPAGFSSPKAIPFQDLTLASREHKWIPLDAAGRVAAWSGVAKFGQADAGRVRQSHAYLARGSQIDGAPFLIQVADVIKGRLQVVPAALDAAAEEIERLMETDEETGQAAAVTLGRYIERLEGLTNAPEMLDDSSQGGTSAPLPLQAEPPAEALTGKAGSHADRDAQHAERDHQLRALELDLVKLGRPGPPPGVADDGYTSPRSTRPRASAHLGSPPGV